MNRVNGELRAQIMKEARETGNAAMVARRHGVSVTSLYYWLKRDLVKTSGRGRIQKLERELEKKKMENEILKELLKKTNLAWLGDSKFPDILSKKGN